MFFNMFPDKPEQTHTHTRPLRYTKRKQGGGTRSIFPPSYEERGGQRRFHEFLLDARRTYPWYGNLYNHAMGGIPRSSRFTHVAVHRNSRHFFRFDLESAFDRVSKKMLARILCNQLPPFWGKRDDAEEFLDTYFMVPGQRRGLRTGNVASPTLFNLYVGARIDRPLQKLCHREGLILTHFFDDYVLSSVENSALGKADGSKRGRRLRAEIIEIVRRAGFAVRFDKDPVSVFDLKRIREVIITGVGLQYGARMFLPQAYLKRVSYVLECARTGKLLDGKRPVTRCVVQGYMSAIWQLMPYQKAHTAQIGHILDEACTVLPDMPHVKRAS